MKYFKLEYNPPAGKSKWWHVFQGMKWGLEISFYIVFFIALVIFIIKNI